MCTVTEDIPHLHLAGPVSHLLHPPRRRCAAESWPRWWLPCPLTPPFRLEQNWFYAVYTCTEAAHPTAGPCVGVGAPPQVRACSWRRREARSVPLCSCPPHSRRDGEVRAQPPCCRPGIKLVLQVYMCTVSVVTSAARCSGVLPAWSLSPTLLPCCSRSLKQWIILSEDHVI